VNAILIAALLVISAQLTQAQAQQRANFQPGFPGAAPEISNEELPRFDIDFPGGYPNEFVEAIQKALDKVSSGFFINVIIPEETNSENLPALKMRNVDVSELFKALEMASVRQTTFQQGGGMPPGMYGGMPMQQTPRYGFRSAGPITHRTIWYFYVEKTPPPIASRIVRYYQLAPYLTEFTMDDIGSAIEAGWNMLGEKHSVKLNFHQDTKLLIAAGEPGHLEMISAVLRELGAGMTNRHAAITKATKQPEPQPAAKF
jgi:hypothetical protein